MSIHESQLVNLRAFGYTQAEAQFLYLVAAHSGYFTVRQFLDFSHARSGKRNARFVEKLFGLGHGSAQRYMRRSLVYHVRSRQLYEAIGKAHLRNRRVHELDYIKTRLLGLDFILANPEDPYFETAEEKRQYLIKRFKLSESLFSPSNEHGKGIMFSEGFPLCVAYPSPDFMPVVTFTYVDPEHRNLDRYIAHLRTYRPLFRQLPSFQFIYVSTAAGLQNEAAELFSFLVEAKGLSDLARYFDVQTKWDNRKYGLLTEDDLIFRHETGKRFNGEIFGTLLRLWRRNQLPNDLRAESATTRANAQKVLFRAVTVPGQEAVFGDSRKRWGDGSQIRGTSSAAATGSMPWFVNLMEELGIECQVGNPAVVRAAEPRKQKHDRRDAGLILKLLMEDCFPAIWLPSKELQDLRALVRHRHQWVRIRTRIQNALQSIALANGLRRGPALWSQAGQHMIASLPLAPHAAYRRSELQAMYEKFAAEIEKLNQRVEEQACERAGARLLMTHPGVGPVTALATEVFLGDLARFADSKALASYVGMIPREYSSGGRQRLGGLSKQGNALLRFLWGEAGAHAVRRDPALQRFYRRKLVQKGLGKARVAVARKLGIRLWIMLRDQMEYNEFCRRGQKQQNSGAAYAGRPGTRNGATSHRPVD